MKKEIEYGAVLIIKGKYKGRVGYYDDDETNKCAIIYFGNFIMSNGYHIIRYSSLRKPTVNDLIKRYEEIETKIFKAQYGQKTIVPEDLISLLFEHNLVKEELVHRRTMGKNYKFSSFNNLKVFISYTSSDKPFVRQLHDDLVYFKVNPWFDEVQIKGGESIPHKINLGLETCNVLLLICSLRSVKSIWVQKEWEAKFMDENLKNVPIIIPILIEICDIPTLLRPKKWIDFRDDYYLGLNDLLETLESYSNTIEKT